VFSLRQEPNDVFMTLGCPLGACRRGVPQAACEVLCVTLLGSTELSEGCLSV
jgi:hypothetical protein